MNKVLVSLKEQRRRGFAPVFQRGQGGQELISVLMTTDKGLCGALNTNLSRRRSAITEARLDYVTIGRKGAQQLARLKRICSPSFRSRTRPFRGTAYGR